MRDERLSLIFGGRAIPVDARVVGDRAVVRVENDEMTLTVRPLGGGRYAVTCDGPRMIAHHATDGRLHYLHVGGEVYTFQREARTSQRDRAEGVGRPAAATHHHDTGAPMPGLVTQVLVQEGQTVAAGEPLFVVEAMKMEHIVRAPKACRVTGVKVGPGTQVEGGAIVVEVEDLSGTAA